MLSVALKFLSQAPLPPPPLPGCSVPRFHAGAFGWGRQQVLPRGPTRPAIPRHRALRSSGSRIRAPSLRQHPGGWNAGPGSPGELAVTSHGVGPCSPGVPQVNVPVRICDWSSPDTWGAPPSSGRLTERHTSWKLSPQRPSKRREPARDSQASRAAGDGLQSLPRPACPRCSSWGAWSPPPTRARTLGIWS